MSDIQRWDMNHVQGEVYIDKKPEGSWVTYSDHVAAVAAARIEWEMTNGPAFDFARGQSVGFAAGVKAARDAVEEQCKKPAGPMAMNWDTYEDGMVDALAAIDGVKP